MSTCQHCGGRGWVSIPDHVLDSFIDTRCPDCFHSPRDLGWWRDRFGRGVLLTQSGGGDLYGMHADGANEYVGAFSAHQIDRLIAYLDEGDADPRTAPGSWERVRDLVRFSVQSGELR